MKDSLKTHIQKRLILFAGNQILQANDNAEHFEVRDGLEHLFFPIIVIGKEHYQETEKRFPVSNAKDLSDVLKYSEDIPDLLGTPVFNDDHCIVPHILLDREAGILLENNPLSLWIPESWILNLEKGQLYSFTRANSSIFAIQLANKVLLSSKQGPFKSKEYFLMSVGADESALEHSLDDSQYIQALIVGIEKLPKGLWPQIVKSQRYHHKLLKGFDWTSIITGFVSGILIFNLVSFAYLTYKEKLVDRKISALPTREVVALQKKFESSKESLKSISRGGFDKTKVENLWDLVLNLMENKVTVLRITPVGQSYELYLESKEATTTLDSIKNNTIVASVVFSTPVRQSVNKERFGVNITFAKNESLQKGVENE